MGAYREQLLRETYGGRNPQIYGQREEEPSGALSIFKLKFTICLFLFAGFAYLSLTGSSFCNVTADQIVEAALNGPFLSREDFRDRCKVSQTNCDKMAELGLLGDIPISNQISLLDFLGA